MRNNQPNSLGLFALIAILMLFLAVPALAAKPTPDGVIAMLKEGNTRFLTEKAVHPNSGAARLKQAGTENQGDHAVATVITCSDSRVPVERLFDMGVMDVFVVRVAGNVCNTDEIGSIEYGLAHVNTPLLVVLGHTQCGAVTAVTNQIQGHGHALERNIPPLVAPIIPAVKKAIHDHPEAKGKEVIPFAIEQNVWQGIRDLFMKSPASRNIVKSGKAKVVGAIYDVGTGNVKWLPLAKTDEILAQVEADPARAMNPMAGEGHSSSGVEQKTPPSQAATAGHETSQASMIASATGASASDTDKMAVKEIIQKLASGTEAAYQPQIKMASHSWDNWNVHLFWGLALVACLILAFFNARVTDAQGNSSFSWSLGAKLTTSFAAVALLLAGISGYGELSMVNIGNDIQEVSEEMIPLTNSVAKIESFQLEQAVALERSFRYAEMAGEHAKQKLKSAEDNFHGFSKQVDKELAAAIKKVEDSAAANEADRVKIADIAKALAGIRAYHRQWEQLADAALKLIHQGKHAQAMLLEEEVEKTDDKLANETKNFLGKMQKRIKDAALQMEADEQSAAKVLMIVAIAGTVIALLLSFILTRGITKPIFNVIAGLSEGSEQVASASGQVANAGQILAEGASEQASSLEETSASMEEVVSMIRSNTENATQADGMMRDVAQVVERANNSMAELRKAMEKINAASDETANIIKTIDEIAFQTNLLALNAAVEAARAGEAGSGFAVVADEVRNLAMRAAEAAKNTAQLIEGNIKELKTGTHLVQDTDNNFKEVLERASKVGELVGEIASASSEQAQGVDQVNTAMNEIEKVTQAVAANAEESAAAAEELGAQAATMQGFVQDLVDVVIGGNKGRVTQERHSENMKQAPRLTHEG